MLREIASLSKYDGFFYDTKNVPQIKENNILVLIVFLKCNFKLDESKHALSIFLKG